MSTVTLAESAKLAQDELIEGVIENIITVNKMYTVLPFRGIDGNALAYDRENALGDSQALAVGGTITAKAPATFTQVSSTLTTLIGDAEVNMLIQATRSGVNDQKGTQIASKAKSVGRLFQNLMINGDGVAPNFPGLLALVGASQVINAGAANGGNLSFTKLDELLDLVIDKDGEIEYIQMPARTIRAYSVLLRALGGASINEVVTLPDGTKQLAYRNVPIFRNDWIPTNQTFVGSSSSPTTCTTVLAGTLDDGSGKYGIAGLTAARAAGIGIDEVGIKENADETITRVKWYCGMACFNLNGLAGLQGVLD